MKTTSQRNLHWSFSEFTNEMRNQSKSYIKVDEYDPNSKNVIRFTKHADGTTTSEIIKNKKQ